MKSNSLYVMNLIALIIQTRTFWNPYHKKNVSKGVRDPLNPLVRENWGKSTDKS